MHSWQRVNMKTRIGVSNVLNKLTSFGKAGPARMRGLWKGQNCSFRLSLWPHQASGSSLREIEESIEENIWYPSQSGHRPLHR